MSRRKADRERIGTISDGGDRRIEPIRIAVAIAVIVAATVAVFWRTFSNGFVRWDDYENLVNNDAFRGLGWRQLRWMFSEFHAGHYHPLTWLTFAIDSLVWGGAATGYHVTSVLIHAGTAIAVFFLARRLVSLATSAPHAPVIGAAVAAIVFAIHPMRVESVAWATERRDVLSGLFYVLAVLAYLRWRTTDRPIAWIAATHGLFLLALLAKVMAVTLPALLIVLDVYPLRRLHGRSVIAGLARSVAEKLPMFAMSAVFALLAVLAQQDATAMRGLDEHGLAARALQVLYGLGFYVWKTVLPIGLAPLYTLPNERALQAPVFWFAAATVAGAAVLVVVARRRVPALLAVGVAYAVILSPVSGAAQNGPQITADRYSYLSCIGFAILIGCGIDRLRKIRRILPVVAISGAAGLLSLASLTWRQIGVWSDSAGMWIHVLAVDGESQLAWNNLGVSLLEDRDLAGAIHAHEQALKLNKDDSETCHRLAYVYSVAGRVNEAEALYRHAIAADPDFVDSRVNLAELLSTRGDPASAIAMLEEAVAIDPDAPEARTNLANMLRSMRRPEEAERHYRHVVATTPGYGDAAFNLGDLLVSQQRFAEAIAVWTLGVEASPRDAPMMVNLALALATAPERTLRDPGRALSLAERACELTDNEYARALYAKGQALLVLGRSAEARAAFQRALERASATGDTTLAEQLGRMLTGDGG